MPRSVPRSSMRRWRHSTHLQAVAIPAAIFAANAQTATPATIPVATAAYTVTVRADSVRLLHVDATLRLADTTLHMVPWGGEHIPDGWRTFIKNERATDAAGRALTLERIVGRTWIVKAPINSEIRLSYDVNVQHDTGAWVPDPREAGYSLQDRVFIVGRGLFILPSFTLSNSVIRVVAPPTWKVSTPWDLVPGRPHEYRAATRRDLVESILFVGDFVEIPVKAAGFTVAFGIGPEFKEQASLYDDATNRLLREHLSTFGGTPTWNQMQVVINPNRKVNGGGGGVFRKSISMTFREAPTLAGIPGWGHTLSHELFHVWNAFTLLRGSADAEWLKEGGGDYFGVLALERSRLLSTEFYFMKLRMGYQRYMAVAGKMSLAASGEREAEFPQRELLYNGGWMVLLSLDADLRAKTHGAKSIDDVMRDMYQRTKAGTMPTFATADFLNSVNRVSGGDFSEFFAHYITGTETLPVDKYVQQIGLRVEANGSFVRDAAASSAAKQLLVNYLASKVNP